MLMILDGWGHTETTEANGIAQARTPRFDGLLQNYPHTLIDASGPAVGLPDGIMGNSEVGHMNLGAGRIVYTGLSQIYQAIDNGSFANNPALNQAITTVQQNNSALHLMGLVSDGAVHSHQDHLYALLDLAKQKGISQVYVHGFLDGRDTPPMSGKDYITQLETVMATKQMGQIASISGRYYAMDRDQRWDRIELAFQTLSGQNTEGASSAAEIVDRSYKANKTDEFVVPQAVVDDQGRPIGPIGPNDAVVFFNFRADRAREITQVLTDPDFNEFDRQTFKPLNTFVCMAPYDDRFDLPIAFEPNLPQKVLAEILSEKGKTQLHIAETEKYAHVTFFFNGGKEQAFPNEDRILVPSPREVPTYDHKPEMNAQGITDQVLQKISSNAFDVIILNFANSDMVGHTAKSEAIIKAVEVVDQCIGQIVDAILAQNGTLLITADHGNAEQMIDASGNPHTAHTTNLVPFIVVNDEMKQIKLNNGGRLCDVAPTMLEILKIDQPKEMTGESLLAL